jgi:hypothetical protein
MSNEEHRYELRPTSTSGLGILDAKPSSLLRQLQGRHFTAQHIRDVVSISQTALTNYLTKTDIHRGLCSESLGQGKARVYCLVDVYHLALFSLLMEHTSDASSWAYELNELLLGDYSFISKIVPRDESLEEKLRTYKRQLCQDVTKAHPMYWHREGEPVFIWSGLRTGFVTAGTEHEFKQRFVGGIAVNVTKYLHQVDDLLDELTKTSTAP